MLKKIRQSPLFLVLLPLSLSSPGLMAGPLTEALAQARLQDPQFRQALAEQEVNRINAQAAGTAYYPQLQLSYSQLETESRPRQTLTVSQPLLNADRYATLREREPRERLADATFRLREQELCQRLLKATAELLRLHEGLQLNSAKIAAMGKQALSARRAYELGQGTITDVRDAKVRLDQARAETLTLEAQIGAAQRQLTALTGAPAAALKLRLPRVPRMPGLRGLDDYVLSGVQAHPQLLLAQSNQRIAELGVSRADGALLPVLSAVYTASSSASNKNNYVGLQLSMPLQAGSFYQMKGAAANANRALEQTRDAELRVRLETQRLWDLVRAGQGEVEIRLEAIQSAQLSVEANEKSLKGGVRSQVDVLNSIQIFYQVQQEYVNAVLQLADNHLNLLLQAAVPVDEAMAQVQALLFPDRTAPSSAP